MTHRPRTPDRTVPRTLLPRGLRPAGSTLRREPPMLAGAAMGLSSLTVVLNALRLRRA